MAAKTVKYEECVNRRLAYALQVAALHMMYEGSSLQTCVINSASASRKVDVVCSGINYLVLRHITCITDVVIDLFHWHQKYR